jgi:hypothetical protein
MGKERGVLPSRRHASRILKEPLKDRIHGADRVAS